jgi:hypothetical protein
MQQGIAHGVVYDFPVVEKGLKAGRRNDVTLTDRIHANHLLYI